MKKKIKLRFRERRKKINEEQDEKRVDTLRPFALAHARILIYLIIITYFFYLIQPFFENTYIRLFILRYISLKYYFFIIFLILPNNISLSLSLSLLLVNKILKNKFLFEQ